MSVYNQIINTYMNIRTHLYNGNCQIVPETGTAIAAFSNAKVFDNKPHEVILSTNKLWNLSLGKNAVAINKSFDKWTQRLSTLDYGSDRIEFGEFFYWYSKPLENYYHTILDGLGHLWHYMWLKKQIPNLKLLINVKPYGKINVYPPFVTELLDLFDIEYQYTNAKIAYETIYFSDTLNQDNNGKRIIPHDEQYKLIHQLIDLACSGVNNVPTYEKIYVSRRTHANPKYTKDLIGEDNTKKRGLTNEDDIVEILQNEGYTEVFGENYTLAEKIAMFSKMKKYVSTAGAGVTNCLWVKDHDVSVGGIHTPGFPFPGPGHSRHICSNGRSRAIINIYPGKVQFVDPAQGAKSYNSPWYIADTNKFKEWVKTL